ncbi:hypothetical protein LZ32DRAFT_223880 [Colletotrichum eremochloae]|nr:hypothetical protein LZ32DRAFT_223880 [Colletotrichum eremochloae]
MRSGGLVHGYRATGPGKQGRTEDDLLTGVPLRNARADRPCPLRPTERHHSGVLNLAGGVEMTELDVQDGWMRGKKQKNTSPLPCFGCCCCCFVPRFSELNLATSPCLALHTIEKSLSSFVIRHPSSLPLARFFCSIPCEMVNQGFLSMRCECHPLLLNPLPPTISTFVP